MKTESNLKTLTKKEAQEIIDIFKKDLMNQQISEMEKSLILKFKQKLKRNSLQCVVISKQKIIYCFGSKVEKYINDNISNNVKEFLNDKSLSYMRAGGFEIINDEFVRGAYSYRPIKYNEQNIGAIIFIYKNNHSEEVLNVLSSFISAK